MFTHKSLRTFFLIAFISLTSSLNPAPAHAGGVVTVCDESHLDAALSGGGTVTFACSGTITLTSTKTISSNTTIDGSGQSVTISGNNSVKIFSVNAPNGGITLNLNNLTLEKGNGNAGSGDASGGAIKMVNGGTLTITNSTFSGNSSVDSGGAIYIVDSTLTIANSTFSGNSARLVGAISILGINAANDNLTPTITNSTFSGNSAQYGGTVRAERAFLTIINSTFSSNGNSSNYGGIVRNDSGTLTIINSTFSGNSASIGGTVRNDYGTLTITNSTFSGNIIANNDGVISNSNGTLTLANTIVANSIGANCGGTSSITDGGNNLSYEPSIPVTTCPGINQDPKLAPLANNGGATQTMALQSGSAAIGAGNSTTCANAPVSGKDQRGKVRPATMCDIGAFQVGNVIWTGAGADNNWSTAANWSDGIAPNLYEPVFFDSTSTKNSTMDTSFTIPGLTVNSGYSGTISQNANALTIKGNYSQSAGTFNGGSNTLTIGGNWSHTGGTFTPSTGTVNFDAFNGSGNTQTLSGNNTFNNLTINHSGANNVTASGGTLSVTGLLRIQAGTFTSASNYTNVQIDSGATLAAPALSTLNVSGNWTNNGAFTASTSTVVFNGTGAQTIGGANDSSFNDLTINNSGGSVTLSRNETVGGVLMLLSDLTTSTFILIENGFSDGSSTADVVGTVRRADLGATKRAFGNPFNTITINSGTAPTQMDFNLAKSAPSDFTTAINRTYTITPTAGGGFSATLRLHYLDAELNGKAASALELWKFVSSTWTNQGRTGSVNTTNKWAEFSGVTGFSRWTLAWPATTTTITNSSALGTATTVGQSYAVNYSVTSGSGTPTGNVMVSDGTDSCTATVAAATCNLTSTTPGDKTITAAYQGDSNFNPSTSSGVAHAVNQAPVVITQPTNQTVDVGSTASFTAAASGSPTPTLHWQSSTDGTTWSNISGAINTTYSFTARRSDNAKMYRAVFTNVAGSATTTAATLTVNTTAPTILMLNPNSAKKGGPAFTLVVTGTNFADTSFVRWNGSERPTTFRPSNQTRAPRSSTVLTATITAADIANVGVANITVFNPAPGGGDTSNAMPFFITTTGAQITSSNTVSGTNPFATTGGSNGVTANATGNGTITVGIYDSNPSGTPLLSIGTFMDVHVVAGNTFTSVTIEYCALKGSKKVYWWNGTTWKLASHVSYNPGLSCTVILVNDSTFPDLSQLTGTPFGAVTDFPLFLPLIVR